MAGENVFKEKSIKQLILLFSLPMICSLVLESVAAMIDTAFAGHLGNVSTVALSAMGLLNPVLALLIAAQLIFGVSTSIIISKRLGENNKSKINDTLKVGFYASLISSAAISIAVFLFQNQLLNVLGATGEVRILAKEYLNVAIVFNVFSSIGYMLVNTIRVFGYPKVEIIIVVLATLIHILFNIIFVFLFHMGIKGIAIATLVSEVFYFTASMLFLMKKGLWIKKSELHLEEIKNILVSLLKIGFVQFLMQSLNSASAFVINKVLIQYGSISYIGAWSICSNINTVILLPLVGLTQGVQSVIAYFHGSKNKEKETMAKHKTIQYSFMYSISITLIVYLFAEIIIKIFTSDMSLVSLSIPIVRIIVIGFPFLAIIFTAITFMQVLGKESVASKLEVMRQVIILIPLIIILPMIFTKYNIINIPPQLAIFLAMPLSTIIIVFLYFNKIKKVFK